MEMVWNKLIYTAIVLGLVFLLRYVLIGIIQRTITKWELVQSRTKLIKKTLDYVYFIIVFIFLLLIWGINLDDVGLFVSSVFAVIGIALFAQWSILSNITSGVIMFFTFPYRIGDFIQIYDGDNSVFGYIEDIRSFQVVIKGLENEIITYPNSLMLLKGIAILDEAQVAALRKRREEEKKKKEGGTNPT